MAARTSDPSARIGSSMRESTSASANIRKKFKTTVEDVSDDTHGETTSDLRRHPAEVKAFWHGVRANLWIADDEITPAKTKAAPKRRRAFDGGMRTLTSRLDHYGTYQAELLQDKRRISRIPSAERR